MRRYFGNLHFTVNKIYFFGETEKLICQCHCKSMFYPCKVGGLNLFKNKRSGGQQIKTSILTKDTCTFTSFSPKSCFSLLYSRVYWSRGTSLSDPLLVLSSGWISSAHLHSLGSKWSCNHCTVGHKTPSLLLSFDDALSATCNETLKNNSKITNK